MDASFRGPYGPTPYGYAAPAAGRSLLMPLVIVAVLAVIIVLIVLLMAKKPATLPPPALGSGSGPVFGSSSTMLQPPMTGATTLSAPLPTTAGTFPATTAPIGTLPTTAPTGTLPTASPTGTLSAPKTVPAPAPAPVACQLTAWSDWGPCGCLTNSQKRTRSVLQAALNGGAPCTGALEEVQACTPAAGACSDWQRFQNTYISDGEYLSRTHVATESACYKTCENDPNCAGVYLYNGPETAYLAPLINECSLVSANNVGKLYDRYGTMTRFNPDNRVAYIHRTRAGGAFRPDAPGAALLS